MKYKVGDKVRVRQWKAMEREFGEHNDHEIEMPWFWRFTEDMKKYCGKVVTIKEVQSARYYIEEVADNIAWNDEMFEGYAFEYGDEIEGSDDKEDWQKKIYMGYIDGACYPYMTTNTDDFITKENCRMRAYKYARPIQKQPKIEIEIKINGEKYEGKFEGKLSAETLREMGVLK